MEIISAGDDAVDRQHILVRPSARQPQTETASCLRHRLIIAALLPPLWRLRPGVTSTDVLREADGLASWLAQQQGNIVSAKLPELIASFLASDSPDEQLSDDVDLGDADIFAEIKVSQFLRAVGLSVPRELPSA